MRRSITVRVPIKVDYEATALGHELIVKFRPFGVWSVGERSQPHDRAFSQIRPDGSSTFSWRYQAKPLIDSYLRDIGEIGPEKRASIQL